MCSARMGRAKRRGLSCRSQHEDHILILTLACACRQDCHVESPSHRLYNGSCLSHDAENREGCHFKAHFGTQIVTSLNMRSTISHMTSGEGCLIRGHMATPGDPRHPGPSGLKRCWCLDCEIRRIERQPDETPGADQRHEPCALALRHAASRHLLLLVILLLIILILILITILTRITITNTITILIPIPIPIPITITIIIIIFFFFIIIITITIIILVIFVVVLLLLLLLLVLLIIITSTITSYVVQTSSTETPFAFGKRLATLHILGFRVKVRRTSWLACKKVSSMIHVEVRARFVFRRPTAVTQELQRGFTLSIISAACLEIIFQPRLEITFRGFLFAAAHGNVGLLVQGGWELPKVKPT